MCEIIGSFPTVESVHRTLISLLEEQWQVKFDYELKIGVDKNDRNKEQSSVC